MAKDNEQKKSEPLETKAMRTTADGEWIIVNGQRFKRTVLKSSAVQVSDKETQHLLDELEEDES